MKFVCDRCQTRYSIADEKVRQKILRIRCKTCGNVIAVQGERPGSSATSFTAMPGLSVGASKVPVAVPQRPGSPPPPPFPSSEASPPAPIGGGVEWYVAIHGAQAGPFSRGDAAKRVVTAKAGQAVHVWKEGMTSWKPAREVSVIARELSLLRRPPPPPPAPPQGAAARQLADREGADPKASASAKMSKTSSLSKTPNVSTASEIRTPRPYLPTSSAPATLASLAISQISVAKPEAEFLEFHEDPTTKKVKPLPDLSAPLAMVAEEKTPPPAHPLPPVLLTLDEARVGPASRTPAPLAPGAAVGSSALDAFSEIVQAAAASASSSIQDSIASSLASIPDPLQPSADASMAKPVAASELPRRHQGLKYVIAAAVIVVLVIVLVVVTLRGDMARRIEPVTSAGSAGKVELPPVEEPSAVEGEAPNSKGARGEKSAQVTRTGIRHGGSSGRSAIRAVAPTPEQEAAQRRMAKAPVQSVAPARPNPFVEGGKPVSQDQISAVVRNKNNQAALKTCYERALKMDNRLTSGRIDVTVSIGTSGIVQRVIIDAPSAFLMIEPCIKNAVKRWVFPPNSEEYGTNFPLIMQGGT
jgi:predicted Zn finger-like uncharacterized protein